MEITKFLYDKFWEFLQGMNVHLGCFIIRWGLWMLIASAILYVAWARLHSRTRFTQILAFVVSTTMVFILPLDHLTNMRYVYESMILLCFIAMICLPPRVAFFLTPIRGQQISTMWTIYGLEAVLFLIQLMVM